MASSEHSTMNVDRDNLKDFAESAAFPVSKSTAKPSNVVKTFPA
jgi:hypothetical protein